MFSPISVLAFILAYTIFLFAIAQVSERTAYGRRWASHPVVYSLGLAVYCTTWTYYGSVGKAATGGMGFLPVYLGPTLALLIGGGIYERAIRLKEAHRITSIADFVSARYGKSQAVAALVTVILMVGIVPYVGLQLKALSSTFELLTTAPGQEPSVLVGFFTPIVAVMMTVFTIVFGIRHLDPTERHPGMVVSLAAESILKLTAFLMAGTFIVGLAFGDFGGFLQHFRDNPPDLALMGESSGNDVLTWATVGTLSVAAFAFLPRQFHVGVVEASDPGHVRTARWMTPAYLFLINIFVVPIALGGTHLALEGISGDQFVLAVPIHAGASALSIAVFVGGFSAAIGMIMIESMTMSTMIANHLLMPLVQAVPALSGLKRHMLVARWVAAGAFIAAGYAFEVGIGGSYMLVAIGLISFASAFLLAPVVLGGLYWRQASRGGALMGLGAGFVVWFYSLLMPTFVKSGWLPDSILSEGPLGIALLRPEALFGMDGVPNLAHGVMWSGAVTVGFWVLGTVLFPADAEERQLTESFLDIDVDQTSHLDSKNLTIAVAEKRKAAADVYGQYYPREEVAALVDRTLKTVGISDAEMMSVVQYASLYNEVERTLSGAIGAASAHGVMKDHWGVIDRKDARTLARQYARTMARLKLSPAEIKQRIDYQEEREKLLNAQFQELQKHNEQLEEKVQERTREIQTILDNVVFGFLVIDMSLEVREGFTQSCHDLFARQVKAGDNICDLLGLTKPNDAMHFQLCVEQLYDDFLPEELLLAQMPKRFEYPDGRILFVEARVIRTPEGEVEALLMTVSDITALEEAQAESHRNRILVAILQQKEAFSAFLADTRNQLEMADDAFERDDHSVVRRVVHTIKGNTATYGIRQIADMIHKIEEEHLISPDEIARIRQAFRAFLESNHDVLNLDFEVASTDTFVISQEHVETLKSMLDRFGEEIGKPLRLWAAKVIQRPAGKVLGPIERYVDQLSERLGKQIEFNLEGADCLIDVQLLRPVISSLPHLLRNAVDHGVEMPSGRSGKPDVANVTLAFEDDGAAWRIVVQDDGRGVDVDTLLRRAIADGSISAEAAKALDPAGKLRLVLIDGLTTLETATELSGRGVGMPAVLAAVSDLDGTLEIWSELGVGTKITLTIPKPPLLASAA